MMKRMWTLTWFVYLLVCVRHLQAADWTGWVGGSAATKSDWTGAETRPLKWVSAEKRLLVLTRRGMGACADPQINTFPGLQRAGWTIGNAATNDVQVADLSTAAGNAIFARYQHPNPDEYYVPTLPIVILLEGEQEIRRHEGYIGPWGVGQLWDGRPVTRREAAIRRPPGGVPQASGGAPQERPAESSTETTFDWNEGVRRYRAAGGQPLNQNSPVRMTERRCEQQRPKRRLFQIVPNLFQTGRSLFPTGRT